MGEQVAASLTWLHCDQKRKTRPPVAFPHSTTRGTVKSHPGWLAKLLDVRQRALKNFVETAAVGGAEGTGGGGARWISTVRLDKTNRTEITEGVI